jgi:hypothetical protein
LADLQVAVFSPCLIIALRYIARKKASALSTLYGTATLSLSSRQPVTFSIFSCFPQIRPVVFQAPGKAVILRVCDFFDLFVFSASSDQLYFKPPDKAVILSEALSRSIANRGLHSAESKDPGDASWQMLLGAFRPQTTPVPRTLRGDVF